MILWFFLWFVNKRQTYIQIEKSVGVKSIMNNEVVIHSYVEMYVRACRKPEEVEERSSFFIEWQLDKVPSWYQMSGSVDPWRSVTNSQHPDPDRPGPSVWCVMRPSWHGPDHSPVSLVSSQSGLLHPAFSFQILTWGTGDGARDVRLGLPGRPGWTWRGRARAATARPAARPARHTGAAMRASETRLSCEWSEESETCEQWRCSSHCMAGPPPHNKICQKVAVVRGTYPCPRAGILAVIMTTNFTLSTTTTRKPLGSTPETGN